MKKLSDFNRPFKALEDFNIRTKKPSPNHVEIQPAQNLNKSDYINEVTFENAMKGVQPLNRDRIEQLPADNKTQLEAIRESLIIERKEAIKTLQGIVSGKLKFDIRQTGEYVEAHIITLEPSVLLSLKKGELAVQSHIDLHGFTSETAKEKLKLFIHNSYSMGFRCVLVIHGRGLKSPGGPVIKNSVINWLTRGGMSQYVLAFCSARLCDGGTGAIYVLLKRRPEKKKLKRTA